MQPGKLQPGKYCCLYDCDSTQSTIAADRSLPACIETGMGYAIVCMCVWVMLSHVTGCDFYVVVWTDAGLVIV